MNDEQSQQDENNNDQFQKDLIDATARAEANLSGWKRAAADFENYKRRKEAESKELVEFAREITVAKLLPALDSLEQALRHMPEYGNQELGIRNQESESSDAKATADLQSEVGISEVGSQEFRDKYQNWQTGVNGIVAQLDKALGELGVKKIEAIGKKFDPHLHEAVKEVEGDEDQIIVDELQTGFELNGKVIRPSQVVISKKSNK